MFRTGENPGATNSPQWVPSYQVIPRTKVKMVGEDDELEEYHLHGPSGADTRKISAVLVSPVVVLLFLQLQAENSDGFFPIEVQVLCRPSCHRWMHCLAFEILLQTSVRRCPARSCELWATIGYGGFKNRLKVIYIYIYITYHWLITIWMKASSPKIVGIQSVESENFGGR